MVGSTRAAFAAGVVLVALGTSMLPLSGSSGTGTFDTPVDLSAAGSDAEDPQVAINDASAAVVVWFRDDGSHARVQVSSRTGTGASFGAPVDLSAAGGHAYDPQVAINASGDAVVVWVRDDGSDARVQVSSRSGAGGSFGAPVDLSVAGQDAEKPQVALDDAVVVWHRSDGSNSRVQASLAIAPASPPVPSAQQIVPRFTG